MHEFSIAEAVLRSAIDVAEAHGRHPVKAVRVQIGRMRQIVPDALAFAYEALSADTMAAGSRLDCVEIPLQVRCRECQCVFEPDEVFWTCPGCSSLEGDVIAGEELILESVVLEDGEG
ncbi:MAG: hydrogenase maturation nickel metallochaperone HypA [Candidatus Hydrogenedentes bacterium]|nr:hydrogenase maturation nickel metallochaperone HypA [Candidatus Hydrogenedentota bacterium]